MVSAFLAKKGRKRWLIAVATSLSSAAAAADLGVTGKFWKRSRGAYLRSMRRNHPARSIAACPDVIADLSSGDEQAERPPLPITGSVISVVF